MRFYFGLGEPEASAHRKVPPDGVPCAHPGCLAHHSRPCEGCGRIGGRSTEPLTSGPEDERVYAAAEGGRATREITEATGLSEEEDR